MCQSKSQGGQRCYKDECPVYKNSIKNGNVDRAKQSGRSIILTPNSIDNYRSNGETLVGDNKPVIVEKRETVNHLENLNARLDELEANRSANNTNVQTSEQLEARLQTLQARIEENEVETNYLSEAEMEEIEFKQYYNS